MNARIRRSSSPSLEPLEARDLLSTPALDGSQAALITARAAQLVGSNAAPPAEFKIERNTTFIAGTLIPARHWKDGKGRGALLVAGETAWDLDLNETKGLSQWAKTLSHRQVVAIGTAEVSADAQGKLKRKFKVTWIEPLKLVHSPRLYPAPGTVHRLI